MKFGLKVYPEGIREVVDKYLKIFDYFEIYANPDVENYDTGCGIEFTVHAAHISHGFDLGDESKYAMNKRVLDKAKAIADTVQSDTIVVHPGFENNSRSRKTMLDFLDKNYDSRFAFENCILLDETQGRRSYLFSTPGEMGELIDRFDSRLVLDFGHAICSANATGRDPNKMISEFMELKPGHFHLSGNGIGSVVDTHNHLSGNKKDYLYIQNIPKNSRITLESGNARTDRVEEYLRDLYFVNNLLGTGAISK